MGVTVLKAHDSRNETLVPADPYVEGDAVYTVAVALKTQEELDADAAREAASVRGQRTIKLAESDWTQLPDAPQPGFPWDIEWPAQPE